MDVCRSIVQVVLRPEQTKGFVLLKKRWVVERTIARNLRSPNLSCNDPARAKAVSVNFDRLTLFKHPLRMAYSNSWM